VDLFKELQLEFFNLDADTEAVEENSPTSRSFSIDIPSTISTLVPTYLAVKTPRPSGSLVETEGIPDNRKGP
jgi:hypothetical protein